MNPQCYDLLRVFFLSALSPWLFRPCFYPLVRYIPPPISSLPTFSTPSPAPLANSLPYSPPISFGFTQGKSVKLTMGEERFMWQKPPNEFDAIYKVKLPIQVRSWRGQGHRQ